MGSISLPVMLKYGYDKKLASGVILASGTLGQIIPPSIVLVVLGDQMGVSVGELFLGAFIPGVMLAGMYALYTAGVAVLRPHAAPALPIHVRDVSGLALAKQVALVLMPPLVLILLVLGSIFTGIATPTEAGAVGAVGAMALAAGRRRLRLDVVRGAARETSKLTTLVVFLLIGSTMFALVFRGMAGDLWIEDLLTNLPGGKVGLLVAVNLLVFVLGFFLDFFEIAFIIIPLVVPAARLLGIDLVWFGVMLGMNLQTSFLTPPFGFALFYLRGVAPPEVRTTDLYKAVIPFIIIQVIALLAIVVFPQLVTH
jgi:tripartite ATP-independent transporter DctM subunit